MIRSLIVFLMLSLSGALACVVQGHAASSDWIETEGARLRLVADGQPRDGVLHAMIDIELKDGWKTYWREPGANGIPPSIDITASHSIADAEILFPAPERIDEGYGAFIGYDAPVRLPVRFELHPSDKVERIRASVFLGICERICVPVQTEFDLELTSTASQALDAALVAQSFAALPASPSRAFFVDGARWNEEGDRLLVTVRHPDTAGFAEPTLFAAPPTGWHFGGVKAVESLPDGTVFAIKVKQRPEARSDKPENAAVVVRTVSHAMQDTITLP
ncbi:protein-disulfide reductase DsbD domain-containing protein [Pararhizobium haloflavum]|uniref:protein-disulfide reductase DsbD domain-containing protein n=1 Tax=Pararhizobium haloflavum TaxID=2037914 RepID=UPI000C17C0F7|nr:protein-disulfide reductase DsbD domain-containing protein [Pararhizobium haloflavum]